jgi:hypothetical protein
VFEHRVNGAAGQVFQKELQIHEGIKRLNLQLHDEIKVAGCALFASGTRPKPYHPNDPAPNDYLADAASCLNTAYANLNTANSHLQSAYGLWSDAWLPYYAEHYATAQQYAEASSSYSVMANDALFDQDPYSVATDIGTAEDWVDAAKNHMDANPPG